MTKPSFSDENILTILKDRLDALYTQKEALDQKGQIYTTLMTGAVGFLGTAGVFGRKHGVLDLALFVAMTIAYALGIYVFIRQISDTRWKIPVEISAYASRRSLDTEHYVRFMLNSYGEALMLDYTVIAIRQIRLSVIAWLTATVFGISLLLIAA